MAFACLKTPNNSLSNATSLRRRSWHCAVTLHLDVASQPGQLQGIAASTKLAHINTRGTATLSVCGEPAMSDSPLANCTMRCQTAEERKRPEAVRRYGMVSRHCRKGLKRALLLRQYAMVLIRAFESSRTSRTSFRQVFPPSASHKSILAGARICGPLQLLGPSLCPRHDSIELQRLNP